MAFPTTQSHIEAAERQLGVKLPREFRERLMSENGGGLSTAGRDWHVFPVSDGTHRPVEHSTEDIVIENRKAQALDGFPKGAIAIASNRAGEFLVFMPKNSSGQFNPQVCVWNRETHQCAQAALSYED